MQQNLGITVVLILYCFNNIIITFNYFFAITIISDLEETGLQFLLLKYLKIE